MDIKQIKTKLNQLGYGPLDLKDPQANEYDDRFRIVVMQFQREHHLVVDGIVGPKTLAAIYPQGEPHVQISNKYEIRPWHATATQVALRAVEIAEAQVGVREIPQNQGPAVEAFLESVGLGPGYSWCMAFIYWCFEQAARELGVANPLVRTGGVMKQWNETRQKKVTKARRGFLFIMDLGGGAGHTGLVTADSDAHGLFPTVEGNTNDNGSANGDGIYDRSRTEQRMKGFIDLVDLL